MFSEEKKHIISFLSISDNTEIFSLNWTVINVNRFAEFETMFTVPLFQSFSYRSTTVYEICLLLGGVPGTINSILLLFLMDHYSKIIQPEISDQEVLAVSHTLP